jgi:4-oxalmesaconate hydratase
MIIDCHGHFTSVPRTLHAWRDRQLAAVAEGRKRPEPGELEISDAEIRKAITDGPLKLQKERGGNLTLFSPIAGMMGHHLGDEAASQVWSTLCNDLIHRVCEMFPDNFAPVCQLPQFPGVSPANCIAELERCVTKLGFVGCNLSPDPSGGHWRDPPLTDRYWYPIYETLVALDVPAMIHVSGSCNACFHGTGAHYINGDTTAFMQFLSANLFTDFPKLRFIIPHGGGAVPYHWGRYRGLAQDMKKPKLDKHLLQNVFFDTCVYHHLGVELLARVIPTDNILFGSEMIGAVRGVDPETGFHYDDTKRYVDALSFLDDAAKARIFEHNARRVYPRLDERLQNRLEARSVTAAAQ